MRQANDCTEGSFEASGHSPAEGPGRRPGLLSGHAKYQHSLPTFLSSTSTLHPSLAVEMVLADLWAIEH